MDAHGDEMDWVGGILRMREYGGWWAAFLG